ncbi:membrane protein [Roseibium aquae]|uniref:Protoporphyrinogen IX oxidase n=1 Tax=Roseibium aquae TaxID=1323746 RepID=A0A916WWU4_9HYPH|nr:protoporphyrinogen oxidase HemJ [Roseibium aquae]GGB40170.1 membrane protein [Roseibium aquae]
MDNLYLWIKAIHVISIIAWMAAILYLPRLFVYHVAAPVGSDQSETFKVMERRLLKAIMTPAMISSWIFGLWAAFEIGAFSQGWFHAKLLLVVLMSAAHGYLAVCVKKFARDENTKSGKFYRILNEVPTLFMVLIVILVIVQPF